MHVCMYVSVCVCVCVCVCLCVCVSMCFGTMFIVRAAVLERSASFDNLKTTSCMYGALCSRLPNSSLRSHEDQGIV